MQVNEPTTTTQRSERMLSIYFNFNFESRFCITLCNAATIFFYSLQLTWIEDTKSRILLLREQHEWCWNWDSDSQLKKNIIESKNLTYWSRFSDNLYNSWASWLEIGERYLLSIYFIVLVYFSLHAYFVFFGEAIFDIWEHNLANCENFWLHSNARWQKLTRISCLLSIISIWEQLQYLHLKEQTSSWKTRFVKISVVPIVFDYL